MINRVTIMGITNGDTEFDHLPDGTLVARFQITTVDQVIDEKSVVRTKVPFSEIDYHDVECVGPWAQVCGRLVSKGTYVLVEGRLRCRKSVAFSPESKRARVYISVDNLMLPNGVINLNHSMHASGPFGPIPMEVDR